MNAFARNIESATAFSPAILFTRYSKNAKTGPIAVTTSDKATCPIDCAFRGNGCYAEAGPLGVLWSNMSKAGPNTDFQNGRGTVSTIDWAKLCKLVKTEIHTGELWRHNQAGDLPSIGGKIIGELVAQLVDANRGKRGFTYTHHNVLQDKANRAIVEHANANGFTINVSGNNLKHADQLKALNIAPVVSVVPIEFERKTGKVDGKIEFVEPLPEYRARIRDIKTPAGNKVVICPATYSDDVTCKSCGLCQRLRDVIVAFPAHGASKRKASAAATV